MQKKNMALWESVCKTDPKNTKHVNQRGGFTAIGAQSQIKAATEQFGMMGVGWGTKNESYEVLGSTLLKYQAILWFMFEGEKGEFPIASSILIVSGDRVDDDCIKKVQTDAITKGLSRLGFNSDVFEGAFDDNKYVNTPQTKSNYNSGSTSGTPATGGGRPISEKQIKFIHTLMNNADKDDAWLKQYLENNKLGDDLKEVSSFDASKIIDALKSGNTDDYNDVKTPDKPFEIMVKSVMKALSCDWQTAQGKCNDIAKQHYDCKTGIQFLAPNECVEIAATIKEQGKEVPF